MTEQDGTKRRILRAIAKRGTVDNPKDIVTEVGLGAGVHSIVHQLWRLQKQGLVTFRETKHRRILRNIRLTPRGEEEAGE